MEITFWFAKYFLHL